MKAPGIFLIFLPFIFWQAMAQQTIPLYPGIVPNSIPVPNKEQTVTEGGIMRVSNITEPTITVFKPQQKNANGTAVIIFPGGGYWINAIGHEGYDVAHKLNEWGITAFVVKYRIPNSNTMVYQETGALQDAQQAIYVVRTRAQEWGVQPDRIGVMGFSAGGHLASTAGTHFRKPVLPEWENANIRPDFMILIYPVISFKESVTHGGSREQIIGKNPAAEKIIEYSNELQVANETPPTFLVHASDDDAVKPANSILFYEALIAKNVPAELHIYQKGGHGFGMNNPTTADQWTERLKNWLKTNGWVKSL